MNPQLLPTAQDGQAAESAAQEKLAPAIQDRSLPAAQVLLEQDQAGQPGQAAVLFVP